MDLSRDFIVERLELIDIEGWDGPTAAELLRGVRHSIVRPLVRRAGLRGTGADLAEATGWAVAWETLRRPATRHADSPAGVVWVAVRRALISEVVDQRGTSQFGAVREVPCRALSLDQMLESGFDVAVPSAHGVHELGQHVEALVGVMVASGWTCQDARDAVAMIADHVTTDRSGTPVTRWRWVALRMGLPEWRVRRLAGLLLGGPSWTGLAELMEIRGTCVLDTPEVVAAIRSTAIRWTAGPGATLGGLFPAVRSRVTSREADLQQRRPLSECGSAG